MAFNRVERIADLVPLRRALVSVYDKTRLKELVRGLARAAPGLEIYSTGGSYAAIAEILAACARESTSDADRALPRLIAISAYTGQAEVAGGLVKTLDWKIYLGLLAETGNESHEADLARLGAVPFDLVVGDLYPFEAAAQDPIQDAEALRQRIDIGGPAMLRAAAKNFLRVVSLSSPAQYGELVSELAARNGATTLEFRLSCAAKAFERVSRFDCAIAERLGRMDRAELAASYELV